jgi:CRP-like cAMP-binding protein
MKVASVGPGDVIGEVSFIDNSPRTVSVRAAETCTVRAWNRQKLCDTLDNDHTLLAKFAIAMSELLVERLRVSVQRQGMVRPI